MKNRKKRVEVIIELIRSRCIPSQEELARLLAERGYKVTQATLSGLAYDIDMSNAPEILGTIPGSDTIFAVLREDVTPQKAREVFARFLPLEDNIPPMS